MKGARMSSPGLPEVKRDFMANTVGKSVQSQKMKVNPYS